MEIYSVQNVDDPIDNMTPVPDDCITGFADSRDENLIQIGVDKLVEHGIRYIWCAAYKPNA